MIRSVTSPISSRRMMEFIFQVLVCLCLINFTVESELICSQRPIIALVGDDVILPCHFDPPISVTDETVVWTRPDLDPTYVHYHDDGRLIFDRQNPDYVFRTRLFMDGLTKGNVSMKIFRVKLSDAGTYSCSLPSVKKEASIQLIVGELETISSHELVIAAVGDDVILPCRLEPPSDVTSLIVEWKHSRTRVHLYHRKMDDLVDQHENFRGRTSLFHDEIVKGNISLKLNNITEQDEGNYTCFVPELSRRDYVTLVTDRRDCLDFADFDCGDSVVGLGAFFIALNSSLLLAVLAALSVILWKLRKYRDTKNNRQSSDESTVSVR